MANSRFGKFDFLYMDEDGDQNVDGITSLVRHDGTLCDKPEDFSEHSEYGQLGDPEYLLDATTFSNVEFAKIVAGYRDEILAEYAKIVREREYNEKIEARKHHVEGKTIPNKPTIVLGSDTKVFEATIVFPNGSTRHVVFHDDGRVGSKASTYTSK